MPSTTSGSAPSNRPCRSGGTASGSSRRQPPSRTACTMVACTPPTSMLSSCMQRMVAFNSQPGVVFWVAPNRWSALTYEEFAASTLGEEGAGAGGLRNLHGSLGRRELHQGYPSAVDWKAQGKMSPVKDQCSPVTCGSCWAHAAVAAVESKLLIEGYDAMDLSEQACIDCVSTSSGCGGGQAFECLQYMAEQGVPSEGSYPYTAQTGQCASKPPAASITPSPGYTRLPSNSRDALLQVSFGCCS